MAPLTTPRLRLGALYAAQVASRMGGVIAATAVPFAVLAGGGDAREVGIAAFAASVPVVLGGPFGGVLVERVGAVRSSVIADAASGLALAAIPLLAWTSGVSFPALLVLVFFGGLLDLPGESARRVLLPELAAAARIPLERAVGNLEACTRLSTLLGAPLGGLLAGTLGAVSALALTAVAFALAAAVTLLFVRTSAHASGAGTGTGAATATATATGPSDSVARTGSAERAPSASGYWRDLAEGFRFCVRDPLFRLIIGLVVITNLLDAARSSTLLPLYADRELGGPEALGWIAGSFGGGAFLGSVGFGYVAAMVPRRVTFAVCFALAGGPSLLAPALGASLPVMVAASALSGLGAGALNPILGAVELERIPTHMRARVFGLLGAGSWAGIPLGGLIAGIAADGLGVRIPFAGIAVLYTALTLTPLLGGAWRLMERPARGAEEAVPTLPTAPQGPHGRRDRAGSRGSADTAR
jgi:MFS family permease